MIREFETDPLYVVGDEPFQWTGKISVDMAWIATASPYADRWTQISTCGDGCRRPIRRKWPDKAIP